MLIKDCHGKDPHAYLRDVLSRLPGITNRVIRPPALAPASPSSPRRESPLPSGDGRARRERRPARLRVGRRLSGIGTGRSPRRTLRRRLQPAKRPRRRAGVWQEKASVEPGLYRDEAPSDDGIQADAEVA